MLKISIAIIVYITCLVLGYFALREFDKFPQEKKEERVPLPILLAVSAWLLCFLCSQGYIIDTIFKFFGVK